LEYAQCRGRSCVRESDVVGRIGGDEFAVLVTPADVDAASRIVVQTVGDEMDNLDLGWREAAPASGRPTAWARARRR
jgi:GGDEF domain-containing protein